MTNKKKTAVLIVAAGSGLRTKLTTPKQYLKIGRKYVLECAIENFINNEMVDYISVVINENHTSLYSSVSSKFNSKKLLPHCHGGITRSESVQKGLISISTYEIEKVLVHDAARPFTSKKIINECIKGLDYYDVVLPGIGVTDTLWEKNKSKPQQNFVVGVGPDRDTLVRAQTPQAFNFKYILELHKNNKSAFSDDVYLAFQDSKKINIIEGSEKNFKITTQEDINLAEDLMKNV
tara:strand:+ start:2484 stop:3188 length:705 start_codon:yes stop_codon:yes gene_type:complete